MITMHRSNHSKGVTLLETMLAVSLILLGVVLGISQYQRIILKRKVAQIQNSVILLSNALEQYYSVNCYYFLTQYAIYPINSPYTNPAIIPQPSDPSQQSPVLAAYLSTPQLIGNAYAATRNGPEAYTYAINVEGDVPILSISTQFSAATSSVLLSTLQGMLKPNVVTGKKFTWYVTLSHSLKSESTGLTTNLTYLQAMTPPGQAPTILSRQLGMQYVTPEINGGIGYQFANVCAYWQFPKNRCTITGDNTRCDYQKKTS